MSILQMHGPALAARHPLAALKFYLGDKRAMHEALVHAAARTLFGANCDENAWAAALREIERGELVPFNQGPAVAPVGNNLNTTFGKWIYCCVRVLRPRLMVETGVAHGYSSWVILNAMHRNGTGALCSIDLPSRDSNTAYNFDGTPDTGWMVPAALRPRWTLRLGDARQLMPETLRELGRIDMFFHDSDHSYAHMQWEFATVWPSLAQRGVLLSDDVDKNTAFQEFVEKHRLGAVQFSKGGCAVVPG